VTILGTGRHSVAEVRSLRLAKDFDIEKIQEEANRFLPTWDARDIDESVAWANDWVAFRNRYKSARDRAILIEGVAAAQLAIPDSLYPAESEWQGILNALRLQPDRITPTDFQGLYTRLVAAMGRQVDFAGQPQPRDVDDADIQLYQTTEPVADLAKGLGAEGVDTTTKVAIGVGLGILLVAVLRR